MWGAEEVRTNPGEVIFLTVVGFVWVLLMTKTFPWIGLSFRDDVVDRNNVAALIAICGAITASAVIYLGGSLGEGPSYFNNLFSAGLGILGFLVLWILLELSARVSSGITEERDIASG